MRAVECFPERNPTKRQILRPESLSGAPLKKLDPPVGMRPFGELGAPNYATPFHQAQLR